MGKIKLMGAMAFREGWGDGWGAPMGSEERALSASETCILEDGQHSPGGCGEEAQHSEGGQPTHPNHRSPLTSSPLSLSSHKLTS